MWRILPSLVPMQPGARDRICGDRAHKAANNRMREAEFNVSTLRLKIHILGRGPIIGTRIRLLAPYSTATQSCEPVLTSQDHRVYPC